MNNPAGTHKLIWKLSDLPQDPLNIPSGVVDPASYGGEPTLRDPLRRSLILLFFADAVLQPTKESPIVRGDPESASLQQSVGVDRNASAARSPSRYATPPEDAPQSVSQ